MSLTKREQEKIEHATLNELLAILDVNCFLSKRQAAAYLSISVSFLEKLMAGEGLPCYRVKKKILFSKHQIDSWIEQYWAQEEALDIKAIANEAVRKVLRKD